MVPTCILLQMLALSQQALHPTTCLGSNPSLFTPLWSLASD